MTDRSQKLDLVMDARRALPASAAPAAALIIRRLKQNPVAPDAVVWHATATELDRREYDVSGMRERYDDADPSLVASLLGESEHYDAPSLGVA